MTGDPFYHETIRKVVVAFMTLFNNVSIERRTSTGALDSTIKVPITFSSKAKWYRKLREELTSNPKNVSRTLPTMGADITGIRIDPERNGVPVTKHVYEYPPLDSSSSSNSEYYSKRNRAYRRMAFRFDFELSIAARTITDSLMILEQILPFFKPDLSVTVKEFETLNIDTDIAVVMKDISKESTLSDTFDTLDLVTWTIGFEVKGYMYSPVQSQGVILTSLVNLYDDLPDESPAKVADILTEVVDQTDFDIDDTDTWTQTIREYTYYNSSSSSSSG